MREIKFRAMTKNNNVMVFGDLIACPNGEHRMLWFEPKGEMPLDVDYESFNEVVQSSTICQFTGLQDKNGVDIYDGDILNIEFTDEYDKENHINPSKVIWSETSLRWDVPTYEDSQHGLPLNWTGYDSLEVIGNIHEHPNLLK